ncbi:alternative NAD(P)H-ubiquinone oxidoreductase C1, chloroplastic/mitochondrial [Rhododendron vialii]|uniref:alternative NAD(P)H-ubiquinone oxidoreductase C1, chloroplastic/mitochondrial n=1 Tax=Rhododendron vialii TaxID=182163 RepID=UPI00265EC59B|nr:alternative NAD(P)H-ubiquinone oxidoreductase C1, chloroplastic/mitochondrial [Rhododendron vialii]
MLVHATLPASASLITFNGTSGGARQWGKLFFPVSRTKFGTNSFLFGGIPGRGLPIIVPGASQSNGSVGEVSEDEGTRRTYVWPNDKNPRVCILGGGFGGLYTALRLESLEWARDKKPQILLFDQSERFVFKPMLYELLSGEVDVWEIAPRFSDLLGNTSVQFFQDRVKLLHTYDYEGMNASTRSGCGGAVHLESGLVVEYDWLVLALGAAGKVDLVPGAAEFAFPFSTLEDAYMVEKRLRELERKYFGKDTPIVVAVVGCGYAGVELAATVSERLKDKGVVHAIGRDTTILPTAPPGNREAALKVLSSRKIQLSLGYSVRSITKASEYRTSDSDARTTNNLGAAQDPDRLVLELWPFDGGSQVQTLDADLVLWTVGSKPLLPQIERNWLPLIEQGQAETDETLRVKGHPRIFAIGDSSALRDSSGRRLPATAQVAFQQADFAGWNLWAAINNRHLLPFRFQNLGEMMTLGRSDAAVTPSFLEGLTLEGPVGHTARKIAYLARLPTDEHRLKVGISWLMKSAVDSVASLQSTLAEVLSRP